MVDNPSKLIHLSMNSSCMNILEFFTFKDNDRKKKWNLITSSRSIFWSLVKLLIASFPYWPLLVLDGKQYQIQEIAFVQALQVLLAFPLVHLTWFWIYLDFLISISDILRQSQKAVQIKITGYCCFNMHIANFLTYNVGLLQV